MYLVLPKPISDVKKRLNAIVAEVSESGRAVVIGNHGAPVAALVSFEQFQRLMELESVDAGGSPDAPDPGR